MEPMEIDSAVVPTSLKAHNLDSLESVLGCSDFGSIVEEGLESIQFFHFIQTLCNELRVLLNLEECPGRIDNLEKDEVKSFLYELSSFLSDLECAYDELVLGSLEQRFSTVQKRTLLVTFLLSEVKMARLHAFALLQAPHQEADTPLTSAVCRAFHILKMGVPKADEKPENLLAQLNVQIDKRLQLMPVRPKNLLSTYKLAIADHQWATVEQMCHQFNQDCRARNLLLLKRIDVTINSFLWSLTVRKKESEIRSLFAERREDMAQVRQLNIPRVLAATDSLLRVDAASNALVRAHTISRVRPLACSDKPRDRGGRPDEMVKPARESFTSQRGRGRGGYRGGGGDRGRGGSGHGHGGGYHRSAEQQTRQEYDQRYTGGFQQGGGGYQGTGGYNQRGGGHPGGGGGHRGSRGHQQGRGAFSGRGAMY